MNVLDFSKGVEKLVDPMMVGKTHYMQTKLSKLPVFLQRKIIKSATKKADKMPFVVEPYCTFLFYEIPDPTRIERFMPEGFRPARTCIFEKSSSTEGKVKSNHSIDDNSGFITNDDGKDGKYYGIVSMFRIHTSVFWGARAEYYLVAENTKTGLLSWVMMDYISDTISYDEKHGLKSPDVKAAVMTTTCEGDFICEMKSLTSANNSRQKTDRTSEQTEDGKTENYAKEVKCTASLLHGKMKKLNKKLWIEGNTSIAYGRLAGEPDGDLFSLTFFPEEMSQALDIPLADVREYSAKTETTGNFGEVLDAVVSFPFAQHMLSDSPGTKTHYGSETELRKAVKSIRFDNIKTLAK